MNWKVVYTEQAEQDLRGIYEYIAFSLLEPEIAARQAGRIQGAIDTLVRMPMRHRTVEFEPWRSKGLRVMQTDNYLAFYLPMELQETVAIVRILYGGRNIIERLFDSGDESPKSSGKDRAAGGGDGTV
jgi:toxin ParE1/3/4